jgi:hypothetical protein
MSDEVARAMAIGRENEELIALGKAWCTHIRTDRSGLGVGMVEEMTGLPITGGRFTCDYALHPGGLAGMQLAASALGFYEDNCRGCPHRAPGGRIPNLGTWAEPLIAERQRREQAEAEAQRAVVAEREARAAHRRLVGASLSAAGQEVVDLVNRLDLDPADSEAAESLRAAARLAPDAFADELKEMLYTDARLLRSPVLLDALLHLDSEGDPPALHSLCQEAVCAGWGRAEGCRYLAQHGTAQDADDRLLEAIIFNAAPAGWSMFRTRGEPAALLHFQSLVPDLLEAKLGALLRHGEAWRRAAAAAAARAVVDADRAAGLRLLSPLLDGLRHHEDWRDHDEAAGEIGSTVARVLRDDPGSVDAAIAARWSGASAGYRRRLIDCYDSLARHAREPLPPDAGRVVLARAVSALSEPIHETHDFEEDYQGRASDLLKLVVPVLPTEVVSSEVLIGLLLTWLERERELHDTEPTGPLGALEKMGGEARLGGLVRDIADAVVLAGHRDPGGFLDACGELYRGTEPTPAVRAEIVRMAGRVAAASLPHVNSAVPLIYTAMLGDDQGVRAAGVEAAEQVMRALPPESIPPLLAEAVVAGLHDQYLIVVAAAIKAIQLVPVDLIDHRAAAVQLLLAARAYAADRLRDQMVQDALTAAYRLSRDDDEWAEPVRSAALEVVKLMPAYNARETLHWNRWLERHDTWVDAAIHSLRLDSEWQYEHLGDDDKEALLAELGRRRLQDRQIDALAAVELDAAKFDRHRSLLGADVLSEVGRPDLSTHVVGAFLATVPDTIEKRGLRRSVELTLLAYQLEAVIDSGDSDARRETLDRLGELCAVH